MTVQAAQGIYSSPETHHVAVPAPGSVTAWRVTFLRQDHVLTRPQAHAAIQLAAIVGGAESKITRRSAEWKIVAGLAAELGLEPAAAVDFAARPARWQA